MNNLTLPFTIFFELILAMILLPFYAIGSIVEMSWGGDEGIESEQEMQES